MQKKLDGVSRDQLERMYIFDDMRSVEIANVFGVSQQTLIRKLHELGIEPKPKGAKPIEVLRNAEWLKSEYVTLKKSTIQISRETGIHTRTISNWLRKHGIDARPRCQNLGRKWSEEVRAKMSAAKAGMHVGERNPNWRGGSVDPNARLRRSYASKAWVKSVKTRDGFRCVECGASSQKLHAHHVKPWKDFPDLRFDVDNGITLCVPCHEVAHKRSFPAWVHHGEVARAPSVQVDEDIVCTMSKDIEAQDKEPAR